MRRFLVSLLSVAAALSVWAESPTYVLKSAGGATNAAGVIFPAVAGQQLRVVSVYASSDLSSSAVTLQAGAGAYSVGWSNAAGATLTVTRTNGLAANDVLVIQKASGQTARFAIEAVANRTNLTLATATPWATVPGDQVYKMSSAVSLALGATTNRAYIGEAVIVAPRDRPVLVLSTGTAYVKLDSVTARYE